MDCFWLVTVQTFCTSFRYLHRLLELYSLKQILERSTMHNPMILETHATKKNQEAHDKFLATCKEKSIYFNHIIGSISNLVNSYENLSEEYRQLLNMLALKGYTITQDENGEITDITGNLSNSKIYHRAFCDGVKAFKYWKDGEYLVGDGKRLEVVLKTVEEMEEYES